MKTLQAAVGPEGLWEDWMPLADEEAECHANHLVAKAPCRWRIVVVIG